jgi:hypothetical protein
MKHEDELDEVDVDLRLSKDCKQITLTFTSKDSFTVSSFLIELETYLHEVSRASEQRDKPGVSRH